MNKTQTATDRIGINEAKASRVEDIDLQLAMCQSMAEVSDECINRLGVVRNMLEDLVLTVSPKNKPKVSGVEERLKKIRDSRKFTGLKIQNGILISDKDFQKVLDFIQSEIKANSEKTLNWVLKTIDNNEGSSRPKADVVRQITRRLL